jgi:hypothetical protein
MIEVFERKFVPGDDETIYQCSQYIQNMPGYRGHMKIEEHIITADFYKKVI